MPSQLTNGLIPPHTECPFLHRCQEYAAGDCDHTGKAHAVEFSCGFARLMDYWHIEKDEIDA